MKLKNWLKTEKKMTPEEFQKLPGVKQEMIRKEFNEAHREEQLKKNKKKAEKAAASTVPNVVSKNSLADLLKFYKGKYDYVSLFTARGDEYLAYLKDVYMVIRNAVFKTLPDTNRYVSRRYVTDGYEYYYKFSDSDHLEFVETGDMSGQFFEDRLTKAVEKMNAVLDDYAKERSYQPNHSSLKGVIEELNHARHSTFQKVPATNIFSLNADYVVFSNLFLQDTSNNWSRTNPNSYWQERSSMFRFTAKKMDDEVALRVDDIIRVVPRVEKLALRNKEVIEAVKELV